MLKTEGRRASTNIEDRRNDGWLEYIQHLIKAQVEATVADVKRIFLPHQDRTRVFISTAQDMVDSGYTPEEFSRFDKITRATFPEAAKQADQKVALIGAGPIDQRDDWLLEQSAIQREAASRAGGQSAGELPNDPWDKILKDLEGM